MRLLLDTHALIFWLANDRRMGEATRKRLSDPANDILVSVATLWEIVVKQRVGKLQADLGRTLELIEADGFKLLPILPSHLFSLTTLPLHHPDPFDHLLIAQGIAEDATLVSNDRHVAAYPVKVTPASP